MSNLPAQGYSSDFEEEHIALYVVKEVTLEALGDNIEKVDLETDYGAWRK